MPDSHTLTSPPLSSLTPGDFMPPIPPQPQRKPHTASTPPALHTPPTHPQSLVLTAYNARDNKECRDAFSQVGRSGPSRALKVSHEILL